MLKNHKILIVDDDTNLRKLLNLILENNNFITEEAEDGNTTLTKIGQQFYNIAFVDIGLPDISGVKLLEIIKEKSPKTEVIILTANTSVDNAIKSLNLGAYAYVLKPYEIDEILSLIKRILEKQELEIENKLLMEDLKKAVSDLNKANLELKDKNEKLKELDKLKTQFLSNMSHELRTPLNSIIGFAEAITDGLTGEVNDKQKHYLNNISSSGKNLLEIINNLLDLSKIRAGRLVITKKKFDIKRLIEQSIDTVGVLAKRNEITITTNFPSANIPVYADEGTTRQVLLNLLSNAIKFSSYKSEINVTAELSGNFFVISVTDSGIGISEEDQKIIFEEFKQVDRSEVRVQKGTGLGLAIAKNLIELNGGKIGVESKIDEGSRFWFTVPKFDEQRAQSRALKTKGQTEAVKSINGNRPKILVVDDDSKARELIHLNFKDEFEIITAANGQKAIELAKTIKPDVVTLDILLPDIDGWEVMAALKKMPETCEIPIIIMSVIDNSSLGLSLGAVDYFIKPVDKSRFIKTVNNLTANNCGDLEILIIDDEPVYVEVLTSFLKNHKINVYKAYDGEQGLQILKENNIRLVILDLMMPKMNGFELIAKMKENDTLKDIPIIIITGKMLDDSEKKFLKKEASLLIQKSEIDFSKLIELIKLEISRVLKK